MAVNRYAAPLRVVHHFSALCFIAALFLVLAGESLGLAVGNIIWWHKSFGITVLGLTVLRCILRVILPYPAPANNGKLRFVTYAVHGALYALLLLVPLTGWLKSNTKGYGVSWFGMADMPTLAAADVAQNAFYSEMHELLGYSALALLTLHLLAVLWHTAIRRDRVLRRMF
jgi:cytochrome b561